MLAALAAYVIIAPEIRFVALAAVLATWLFSFVNRSGYVPVLASGFVLAISVDSPFGLAQPVVRWETIRAEGQFRLNAWFTTMKDASAR